MKNYLINYQRVVRLDCTVFVRAKDKTEALEKFENEDYDFKDIDELEASEVERDNITEGNVKEIKE